MVSCRRCQQEVEPGQKYCAVCGTPVHGDLRLFNPARAFELIDKLAELKANTEKSLIKVSQKIDRWLGDPVSLQRRIVYTMLASLAIILSLSGASHPTFSNPLAILEWWLILSVAFLIPVHYWLTGIFPLSGLVTTLIGPELSLRRRLLFSLLLTSVIFSFLGGPTSAPPQPPAGAHMQPSTGTQAQPPAGAQAQPSTGTQAQLPAGALPQPSTATAGGVISDLFAFLGLYLVSYYLMGLRANWISVNSCEYSLYQEGMLEKVTQVSRSISKRVHGRSIRKLEITETEMSELQRYLPVA